MIKLKIWAAQAKIMEKEKKIKTQEMRCHEETKFYRHVEEAKESKDNGIDQIFKRIVEKRFPQIKSIPIQVQETQRTPSKQD